MKQFIGYDGDKYGDIETTFARNKATVDGAGNAVLANVPRFDGTSRAVASYCDWQSSGYIASATSYIMASGNDLDGTPLLIMRDDPGNTVKVCVVDDVNLTVTQSVSIAWNSFPGGGGTVAYTPKSAQVIRGTILIYLQRATSGVFDGVTLVYSQNRGTSWTRVNIAATDGGGTHMSSPASYGSTANAVQRGGFWSTSFFPHGGLDADGKPSSMNRIWFTWFDYLIANTNAKGFDMGIVELISTSETEHYTVGVNRRLWSGFYASQTNNLHAHMLALKGNGEFITNIGDGIGKASTHKIVIDLDTYATATPTVTEVFGQLTTNASAGRQSPQIFTGVPAPNGDIFAGNDTWHSPVMRIGNGSTFKLSSPLYVINDDNAGNFFLGWECFNIRWNPYLGWTCGPDGAVSNARNWCRLISYDGEHWAWLNNTDGLQEQHVMVGNCLACVRASDKTVMLCRRPKISTGRPIMLSKGLDNYLHNTNNLYQAVAPTSPNTLRRALWSDALGTYIFADNSQAIPNAPTRKPANLLDPVVYYLGNESAATPVHGWVWLPDTLDTMAIGTNSLGVTIALVNLGSNASGYFSSKIGSDGIGANCTTEQGSKPDRTWNADDPYCYGWVWGNPANNPAASRTLMYLSAGPSISTANVSDPMLLFVGGLYLGEITPWPCPRDSTSNPNEQEVWNFKASPTGSTEYTLDIIQIRSDVQASIANKPPTGPLFVVKRDANNYFAVTLDGPNWEIEVTCTVGGVTGSTTAIAIEDTLRGAPIIFSFSDNGTDLRISLVTMRNGIQTATIAGGSIGYPTQLLFGDLTQANVSNIMVASGTFEDRSYTLTELATRHKQGRYLFAPVPEPSSTMSLGMVMGL